MPSNPDSILDTVKKTVGLDAQDASFDIDIVMHINSAFSALSQLGVGSDSGFSIQDNTTAWTDYVTNLVILGLVRAYVFLYVKLAFDTPDSRFGLPALEKQLEALTWRINVAAEKVNPPSNPFTS